jgi:hypothetical protein
LRLPIPSFYFDGQDDNKWQIVDGLQRVYTLKKFVVDNTLELEKLELLPKFNGYRYNNLSGDVQRRIKSFPIVVYLIQKHTPAEIKFELFKRINRGGVVLEDQEIRHALNQGIPANYVKELAELAEFKQATCYKIKSEQMRDRDFVTRFVSFYLNYKNYQPNLVRESSKKMNDGLYFIWHFEQFTSIQICDAIDTLAEMVEEKKDLLAISGCLNRGKSASYMFLLI